MIREVDLVSYLPPFLAAFKENTAALEAENPEFILFWKAADRALQNAFIATADEYGIARFERILNILPSKEDTLESRRARIRNRWFNTPSHTFRSFVSKLSLLCGSDGFTIEKDYANYRISISADLELFGQVEELERAVEGMIPCNMNITLENKLQSNITGKIIHAVGIVNTTGIITHKLEQSADQNKRG